MARILVMRGRQRAIVPVVDAGHLSSDFAAFRHGYNTVRENAYGKVPWAEFVQVHEQGSR